MSEMSRIAEEKTKMAIVQSALSTLMEHFDTAQIFVSSYDKNTMLTTSISLGEGNLHARRGQADEWLTMQYSPDIVVSNAPELDE